MKRLSVILFNCLIVQLLFTLTVIAQKRLIATEIKWGERIYYYNCHRNGGNDFAWYANNLPANINAKDITINWLFKNKWNPIAN